MGCGCRKDPGRSGFTLFELLLVLFLAGLVAALALPSFSGALSQARFRGGAMEVRAVFSLARTLSASQARTRTVVLSLGNGAFGVEGEAKRVLPEGVTFSSVLVGNEPVAQETARIRFFPDGSADETEIVLLSPDGGRLGVVVDPLTGIAEVRS